MLDLYHYQVDRSQYKCTGGFIPRSVLWLVLLFLLLPEQTQLSCTKGVYYGMSSSTIRGGVKINLTTGSLQSLCFQHISMLSKAEVVRF